jgi:hypothetical protein
VANPEVANPEEIPDNPEEIPEIPDKSEDARAAEES